MLMSTEFPYVSATNEKPDGTRQHSKWDTMRCSWKRPCMLESAGVLKDHLKDNFDMTLTPNPETMDLN